MIWNRFFEIRFLHVLLVLSSVGLIAGCANDSVDDLERYVEDIRETRKGRVHPLPVMKAEEGFRYQASNQRDPFLSASSMQRLQEKRKNSGIHPDAKREREVLESYQLDTLRMVGSLRKSGKLLALVQSPDGVVYSVRKGNYLGHNHGRVTGLSQNKIELVEIIPDGMGGWMERPAQISLKN